MTDKYDVLVIGGGPAGMTAAMALGAAGRRVLVVEQGPGLGGADLFEGCVRSEILHKSAQRLRAVRHAAEFGLRLPAGETHIDWPAIRARKDELLRRRTRGLLEQARKIPALEVRFGRASLLHPRRALIMPAAGDPAEIAFASAIIATGSRSRPAAFSGSGLHRMINSSQLFDLERPPHSLVVIGATPAGMELAQAFATFGTKVTVLEAGLRILDPVDEEIATMLERRLPQQGISLALDACVTRVCHSGGGAFVQYRNQAGEARQVYGEYVMDVAGREACVEGLGLERTAVRFDHSGIRVNHFLESDEPGLYATGDVIGRPMSTHWAQARSLALAHHLLGQTVRFPQPEADSAVILSIPEIGLAGMTEGDALRAGHDFGVARHDFGVDAHTPPSGHADGLLKLIYDRGTRRLLGVHALGEGVAAITGAAALAIGGGLTIETLASSVPPHPTPIEAITLAAQGVPPAVLPS
ncbi:MAG: NAD(P)/FAD-dependent oxidoreductase [Gammaproteobacteria bacterium]|nr:NAD(P)/FAD-dependent oxidoreductase [Gammaproteobacteria bacterium]